MNYYVGRDGTQLGTFSLDQLKADLAQGKLRPTDMAWCEGMDDWKPLSDVLSAAAPEPAPPTPPAIPAVPAIPQQPSPPQIPVSAMPAMEPQTSKLAVWSLVCGIATVFCSCITGIPAIIMGVMALNRIGKSHGTLGGKGLAIAGLCCACTLGITGTAMMAGLAVPAYNQVQEKAKLMQASNNARLIVICLKSYAGDNSGQYPDADKSEPQTSNDAFRILIARGIMEDERPFTAPNSPFEPDNLIGSPPEFKQALEAGENHWAMTKGLSDSADGNAPLIFENPVEASWPPMWDCNQAGKKVPGRAWRSGKIIIARNDGSVMAEQLESVRGENVPLQNGADGKDLFTRFGDQGEFLDVLRK